MAEAMAHTLNKIYDGLFLEGKHGKSRPIVCAVCDELVVPENYKVVPLKWFIHNRRVDLLRPTAVQSINDDLRQCYVFDLGCAAEIYDPNNNEQMVETMKLLLLSPRSTYIRCHDNKDKSGLTCCTSCKASLQFYNMPALAIKNNYCFGSPPACLLALEDVELAFLSPVKQYGYCYSYTGGRQRCIQGSLSFFKVKIRSIVKAITQLDILGLGKDIIVILYGNLTAAQAEKIRNKSQLRVEPLMIAIQWLLENNSEWRLHTGNLSMADLREEIENTRAVLLDKDLIIDAGNNSTTTNNVEENETFRVFFPDGTMNQENGGQRNVNQFKDMVKHAKDNGFDLEYQCNFAKESVVDFKDSTLVNACLLQYPYGRGGMHEKRLKNDGSISQSVDVDAYVEHMSRLSQPHFHKDRFVLILYNIVMRRIMLRSATWRVRNNMTAAQVSTDLSEEDLEQALHRKRTGNAIQPGASQSFIDAVDAVTTSVPHSNDATKRARRNGEAMSHAFGFPSWFLSVTPDDESSYFVLVHSLSVPESEDVDPNSMSDEELSKYATLRHKIRIAFPGICAYYFERVLDVVVSDIIGWDDKAGCSRLEGGIFGKPIAYIAAVEEQGRRTLHAHILVWVKEYAVAQEALHSDVAICRLNGKRTIEEAVDAVVSTGLMQADKCHKRKYMTRKGPFRHNCSSERAGGKTARPKVVHDQSIRNLRNKRGRINCGGAFAYCPNTNCSHVWTSPELACSYLKEGARVPNLSSFPDDPQRLKSLLVAYQRSSNGELIGQHIPEAAYNFHIHTNSCFKKSDRKRKHDTNKEHDDKDVAGEEECRYRLPKRKKSRTSIASALDIPIKWFKWTGEYENRTIHEVNVKRNEYDAFQNESCKAITLSKFSCNTNVCAVFPGPLAGYIFKYQTKDTQKDDVAPYERVADAMRKILQNRKHESNYSESMRRVLAASFAHQSNGIVGSAMASYLTRHKTRFRMSHGTIWCPLRDIYRLLRGNSVSASINHFGKVAFFVVSALNYICRPNELELITVEEFYSKYEVIRATQQNRDSLLHFIRRNEFVHPSFNSKTGTYRQGVRLRPVCLLAKVYERDFPDPATFDGNILSASTEITDDTERYSRQVLLLFLNFRLHDDLIIDNSFTLRLRQSIADNRLSHRARPFLQNLVNTACNAWRIKHIKDDLQRNTVLAARHEFEADLFPGEDDPEDESGVPEPDYHEIEELMRHMDESSTPNEGNNTTPRDLPQHVDASAIKNLGTHSSGYEKLSQLSVGDVSRNFISTVDDTGSRYTEDENRDNNYSNCPEARDIAYLILHKTSRRTRTFQEIAGSDRPVSVLEANGTVKSIIDWATKAGLDRYQKRSFEIFAATYILTYHKDDADTNGLSHSARSALRKETLRLKKLADITRKKRKNKKQLVALLHGPGGSGKSACIDLLLAYAKEYCELFETDYKFTVQTIVVTALTGVAAAILRGETVHSRLYLNSRTITHKQIEIWEETRMVIIDEISFADKQTVNKIHRNLCRLKQNIRPFGGINIIFSGDFRQLEPVRQGSKPLYEESARIFDDKVNCYLELKGMHRFVDDPYFGQVLMRIRAGDIRQEDIDYINTRVVQNDDDIPDDLRYATYYNKDRDAINAGLFEKRCRLAHSTLGHTANSVLIFCDSIRIRVQKRKYVPFQNHQHIWKHCSESHIDAADRNPRMDPVLRLYEGCPVMLPANINVNAGQANGTRAIFEKVVLKPSETATMIMYHGMPVKAVRASQVEYVVVRHEKPGITPPRFRLKTREYTFDAKIMKPTTLQVTGEEREKVRMAAIQVPLLINNATTGHKLQGATILRIFVHMWRYEKNWPYVVLSRVRTLNGLFLRLPLTNDAKKFAVPPALTRMLRMFEKNRPLYWSPEQYAHNFA